MEKLGMRERLTVITELTQGRELANELKAKLYPIITQKETCTFLLDKILSSYDNALEFLGTSQCVVNDTSMFHSPNSVQGSPFGSEGSEPDSKDHHAYKHVAKKRKLLPKWSKQVKLCDGKGFDIQFVDGYNWRKYGQKAILGTNYPRSYYRCTHRHSQGCVATKHVQQSDSDSSIFDITYQGNHSCALERLKQTNKENLSVEKKGKNIISNELALKCETQELDSKNESVPLFLFPSTPIQSDNLEAHFISDQSNFTETSYLPLFSSPATPESKFSINDFGFENFHTEFDFAEINSNSITFSDFALEDMDAITDQVGFGSHFINDVDYFS